MPQSPSERFAVVGAGQMGNGIAHVAAMHGFPVVLIDVSAAALTAARATIEKNLERQLKKGALDAAARDAALGRITTNTSLDAASEATLVVEAATEKKSLKLQIFRDLDRIAPVGPFSRRTPARSRSPRSPASPSAPSL